MHDNIVACAVVIKEAAARRCSVEKLFFSAS